MRQEKNIFKNIYIKNSAYNRMSICFEYMEKHDVQFLDIMNYSRNEFRPVFNLADLEEIFMPDYGYVSCDGSPGIKEIIKKFELHNILRNKLFPKNIACNLIEKCSVGIASGVTGVINGILFTILQTKHAKRIRMPEIIISRPNYPIFEEIAKQYNFKLKIINTNKDQLYLPTFDKIRKNTNKNTIAIFIIHPNNPFFTSYQNKDTLVKLTKYCQKNKIYLITDTIYQNLNFSNHQIIEPLSLSKNSNYLLKIYGPSKDSPFFNGLRIGYYIGDSAIAEKFHTYCLNSSLCPNSIGQLVLGFDLYLRLIISEKKFRTANNKTVLLQNLLPFSNCKKITEIFKKIKNKKIISNYQLNTSYNNLKIKNRLIKLSKIINKTKFIRVISNMSCGNALMCKIDFEYPGDDIDFFLDLIKNKSVGIFPGSIFGMPIKKGNVTFRLTIIHDSEKEIIKGINKIEAFLCNFKKFRH